MRFSLPVGARVFDFGTECDVTFAHRRRDCIARQVTICAFGDGVSQKSLSFLQAGVIIVRNDSE